PVALRDRTEEVERDVAEEALADPRQLVVQAAAFGRAAHHVGHDLDPVHAALAGQDLDQGVGVGDRGGLVADHHHRVLRGLAEGEHAVGDAGGSIYNEYIKITLQVIENIDQADVLGGLQLGHVPTTGRGRDHQHPVGAFQDHLVQLAAA